MWRRIHRVALRKRNSDNLESGWRFYTVIDGNNSKSEVEPLNPTGGVIRHWIPKEDLGKQFGLKPNGATTPQTLDINVTRVKFIPSFNLSNGKVGIGTDSPGRNLSVNGTMGANTIESGGAYAVRVVSIISNTE